MLRNAFLNLKCLHSPFTLFHTPVRDGQPFPSLFLIICRLRRIVLGHLFSAHRSLASNGAVLLAGQRDHPKPRPQPSHAEQPPCRAGRTALLSCF